MFIHRPHGCVVPVVRHHAPLRHAVVIGGGMAGMAAARALQHHVRRVTLIERGIVGGEPPTSMRVGEPPTGTSIDGRAPARMSDADVLAALERLFGRRYVEGLHDDAVERHGAGALERHTRAALVDGAGLELREQASVVGLVADATGTAVGGVVIAAAAGVARAVLDADLVVDASGRARVSGPALVELGLAPGVDGLLVVGEAVASASGLAAAVRSAELLDGALGRHCLTANRIDGFPGALQEQIQRLASDDPPTPDDASRAARSGCAALPARVRRRRRRPAH